MHSTRKHPVVLCLPTLVVLFFWQTSLWAYQVQGRLLLGEDWDRRIYLSAIPSFDDLRTASDDLIVQVADLAEDGSFVFRGNDLPNEDRIYRLHVCKKGDPAATLFIGGREENHLHFVMNNGSEMIFQSTGLFQNALMGGHPTNLLLRELDRETKRLRSPPDPNSLVNRQLRQQRLEEYLFAFTDTCSHGIAGQLALSQLDLLQFCKERPGFIKRKIQEWKGMDAGSPYLLPLLNQVEILSVEDSGLLGNKWPLIWLAFAVLLGGLFFFRKKIGNTNMSDPGRSDLSAQERRVLQMLSKGKSNKEISGALHIQVSTVKSHVSSIYSKLGVRSRKELVSGEF